MTALQLLGFIATAIGLQILLAIAIATWRHGRVVIPDVVITEAGLVWQGFRDFRVTERMFEDRARTQCSFSLAPVDGAPLPAFDPGQFLMFQLAVDGEDAPARVVRCYSMSDTPDPSHYRITVKRAIAPSGSADAPDGLASGWLHDQVQTGAILHLKAPAGQFVFSVDKDASPVFIAGGIGITPILSMLKAALTAQPDRAVHLFYGVRNGEDHAFKMVLNALEQAHPAFEQHVVYAAPLPSESKGQDYAEAGFITLDLLKQTLPHGRHAFYICGPDPMMKALIPALTGWGVDDADIHRESFGPQTAAPKPLAVAAGPVLAIGFRKSGRTLDWTGRDANLLDFAERHAIAVDAGCRNGGCGTCETLLIAGQVTYATPPDYDVRPGHCLLCISSPATAVELDA